MSIPAPSELFAPETLREYEAVRLFDDRAAAVVPTFTITESNAATIVEICRRLDGIPLAIELAAARLNILSVDQINVRLNDRFRLLTGGSRTAVARQRTLEATIDWSYDLLSEAERALLCRLSVFSGGWTLETAEDVCAGNGIESEHMLDLHSHLVDKSLVNVEDDAGGNRRYRCLETVRQYGRERLMRSGDAERLRDRHFQFFVALVRRAEPELIKAHQARWLTRMQTEYDNQRSALEWCLDAHGDRETGLEMAAAMSWFWIKRCYYSEGRQWLERALAVTRGASLVLQTKAFNSLGLIVFLQGDHATASLLLEKGLALGREAGNRAEVAWSLGLQSIVVLEIGDIARSVRLAKESRDAAIASGEEWRQGPALFSLAHEALHAGDHDRAMALEREAVELFRRTGDKWALLNHLVGLAGFGILAGDYTQTETVCAEALQLSQELGERMMTGVFLGILADAQAAQGHAQRGARLWGAMHGLFEGVGVREQDMVRVFGVFGDRFRDRAKELLGDEAFHAALSEGRAMSLTQAVHYALAEG